MAWGQTRFMKRAVQKWGKGLVLRIPKAYAEAAQIRDGTPVELTLEKGAVLIKPVGRKPLSLSKLLKKVSPKNVHKQIDSGSAVECPFQNSVCSVAL